MVMVPIAMAQSFVSSEMGQRLNKAFPIGTLHRRNIVRLQQWQERYHPIVKRRTPKKRRRKSGR